MAAERMIANRYQLQERLGVGGMSTVQLAFDQRLERHVAVKLLAEHLADDPSFVSRFRREALAAARLVHPNVVQVFDFGLDEESDQHYIVMEYVRGKSCAQLLREQGRLRVEEAVDIVTQATRGLDYAHRFGVIHRDVKPGNLLRSEDGVVKLADFGIAKATEQSSITQAGSVLGTAAYLAPEQARGEEAGPASDFYSLGVVTYQLLSGKLPYQADSLTQLALLQQREPPQALISLNAEVSPELDRAVQYALAVDPNQRYSTGQEMEAALLDGLEGITPRPPAGALATGEATAATSMLEDYSRDATGATAMLDDDPGGTEATRIQPARRAAVEEATGSRRAARRRPAAAVAPAAAAAGAPDRRGSRAPRPAAGPERGRGARRALIALVVLALLIAAIAIIAVNVDFGGGSSSDNPSVNVEDIVSDTVDQTVDQLKRLIQENTR